MTPNAMRFGPTVNTEVASPSSGPAEPAESATCCSVRPSVAGKSARIADCAARTFSRRPPAAGTCADGSLEESEPPQPARTAATAAATSARGSLPIALSLVRGVVEAAPEVQAGARPVRAPRLGDRRQLGGRGRRLELVRAHDRVAHPEVTRGQHV